MPNSVLAAVCVVCSSPFLEKQITNECEEHREILGLRSGSGKGGNQSKKEIIIKHHRWRGASCIVRGH